MPKYFCDYCDVYLTHDSMSVRKAHNSGRNHLRNVIDYYQQIGHEKAQSVIDSITNSYAAEGQSGSNPMLQHQQAGGAFPPPGFLPGGPPAGMPPGFPPPMMMGQGGQAPPGMPPMPPGFPPGPGGRGMPNFLPPGFPPLPAGMPPGMPPNMPGGPGQAGSPQQGMPSFPPPGMPPNFQMPNLAQNGPSPIPGQQMSPPPGMMNGGPPGMPPGGRDH